MKLRAVTVLFAAAILSAPALAQDTTKPQTQQPGLTPGEAGPDSGVKPGNMGTTGWNGGRKDSHSAPDGTEPETTGSNPGNINKDSEYATGEDLKGPPARFPPNRTPE